MQRVLQGRQFRGAGRRRGVAATGGKRELRRLAEDMDMAVTGPLRHREIDRSLWLRRGQRTPVRVLRHHLAAGAAYLAASGVSVFDLRRPGTERAFLATASAAVR